MPSQAGHRTSAESGAPIVATTARFDCQQGDQSAPTEIEARIYVGSGARTVIVPLPRGARKLTEVWR